MASNQGVDVKFAERTGAMVTFSDLCKMLAIGESTGRRLLALGKLPEPDLRIGQRIMRWRESTIETWIERGAR